MKLGRRAFLSSSLSAMALAPAAKAGLRLHGKAVTAAIPVSIGAKTWQGWGGFLTTETASSSVNGTNSGNFTIDDIQTLVPAASGVLTYGAAWTSAASSYTLTGGSGKTYTVTRIANAWSIAQRPGAPTHADNYAAGLTQLQTLCGDQTNLKFGDTIYGQDGFWNPSMLAPPSSGVGFWPVANYGGSGRMTLRSTTVDASLDSNGNPNLKHGYQLGQFYFEPDNVEPWPFDFKDVYFLCNAASPVSDSFFQFSNGASGVGFYNSRFEVAAPTTLGTVDGIRGKDITVDGSVFTGVDIAMSLVGAGGVSVTNNIGFIVTEDFLHFSGSNITATANTGFTFPVASGAHSDFIQHAATNNQTDSNITYRKNLFARNNASSANGDTQGIFLASDSGTSKKTNVTIEINGLILTAANACYMARCDALTCRFNTIIMDVWNTVSGATTPGFSVPAANGGSGGTFDRNVGHSFDFSAQIGVVVNTNNVVIAATQGALSAAFPNLPTTGGNQLHSRALILTALTPSSTGACLLGDGTFAGMLFPASPGQTIGPWNDASVWNPSDPTWLAAHPPAS